MSEETCVFHPGQKAVADCAKCGKSFCSVCLITVEGQTLCRGCFEEPKTAPSSLEDLDRLLKKTARVDDDPLGLFGSGTEVGTPVPPSDPAPGPRPSPAPPEAAPPPRMEESDTIPTPGKESGGAPAPSPASFTVQASSEPVPLRAVPGFGYEQPRRDASPLVALGWRLEKTLGRASRALRLPIPVLAGLAALLVVLLLSAPFLLLARRPAVKTVEAVLPVHVVKVQVSQVGELDIATYLELESKLQAMGFFPLIQMTAPQAPSPNFIAAFVKESVGVYAHLMKLPGSMAPRVAFVTVFNNGIWCSTNGFAGKDTQAEFLMNTHHPQDPVDALYVKHMQKIAQIGKREGWVPARMSESRYIAAFTDHFRWYLTWKKIPGYRAAFGDWH